MRRSLFAIALISGLVLASGVQAREVFVQVVNFAFQPAEVHISPGDTVTFVKSNGFHNVVADDGSFSSGIVTGDPFEFSVTFDQAGSFPYFCEPHGAPGGIGMAGTVLVSNETGYTIGRSTGGAWYDPPQDGQGLSLEWIEATGQLAAFWFTFATDGSGDAMWLVGVGEASGDQATLDLVEAPNGSFNQGMADLIPWGTLTLQFETCGVGHAFYESEDGQIVGDFPIQRLSPSSFCSGGSAQ